MQCPQCSPKSGLLKVAFLSRPSSPRHCPRRTYARQRIPLHVFAAAGENKKQEKVPPFPRPGLVVDDYNRRAAFASGVLYIVLYAVRVTVNNIPSGEVFTPIFGGVGAVLIVQTFVNTGKEWFALDTKLVVNQDWLRRRRQQALQQRGRGTAWRGSVVRKNLYRAVDVEQYMELCILLSQELLEAFRLMLESGGAPADILLLLAARAGDVKTIEELLAAGADPLITDQQGREALQLARGIAARRMLAGAARATAKAES